MIFERLTLHHFQRYGGSCTIQSAPNPYQEVEESMTENEVLPMSRPAFIMSIEIKKNKTEAYSRALYAQCLREARVINLIGLCIGLDYQIYNVMNFIEILEDEKKSKSIKIITVTGPQKEEVVLSGKLDQVHAASIAKKINFSYELDSTKHDRSILINTGWRNMLGRGLDFSHRTEGCYSLGFIDQSSEDAKKRALFSHVFHDLI